MLNVEDMIELIEGKNADLKCVYTIVGDMITKVNNIQEYKKLTIEIDRDTLIPIFTVYSEELGDERLGTEVFEYFPECCEEFKIKNNL